MKISNKFLMIILVALICGLCFFLPETNAQVYNDSTYYDSLGNRLRSRPLMYNIRHGYEDVIGTSEGKNIKQGYKMKPFIGQIGLSKITSGYNNIWIGLYNTLIGEGAGESLTNESYCVIIGHDSTAQNIKGEDMLWYVDWDEPLLNVGYKCILKQYLREYIETGKDTKENRMKYASGFGTGAFIGKK